MCKVSGVGGGVFRVTRPAVGVCKVAGPAGGVCKVAGPAGGAFGEAEAWFCAWYRVHISIVDATSNVASRRFSSVIAMFANAKVCRIALSASDCDKSASAVDDAVKSGCEVEPAGGGTGA